MKIWREKIGGMVEPLVAPQAVIAVHVHWLQRGAMLLLLLLALFGIGWHLLHAPLRAVHIATPLMFSSEGSLRAATARKTFGGFYTTDLEPVRQSLAALPWVRKVTVRRHWPDQLEAQIQEHEPLAFWRETAAPGEGSAPRFDAPVRLLNRQGEIFEVNSGEVDDTLRHTLPQVQALSSRASEVAQLFETLNQLLAPTGVHVSGIKLNHYDEWQATLSNGAFLQLGGGDLNSVTQRATRFARALPQWRTGSAQRIAGADLRYANGFSVRLAPATEALLASAQR